MSRTLEKFELRQTELELLARKIFVRDGIPGLSIERIASESGYSRPTIYQHFSCRDAALEIVAENTLATAYSIFSRAEKVEGNDRERAFAPMLAFGIIARFHTDEFHVNETLGFPWVLCHLPESISKAYTQLVERIFRTIEAAVVRAEESGSLKTHGGLTASQVAFHTIAMAFGAYSSIAKNRVSVGLAGAADPWAETHRAIDTYWDGAGWGPDSQSFDYEASREKVMREVFPEYWVEGQRERLEGELVEAAAH